MSEINWKLKYEQLKAKMHSAVDMAFRLGYENGMQSSQVQQAADHASQMNQMAQTQAGAQADPNAQPGEQGGQPGEETSAPASEHPDGSELDQHIAKLESLIAKGELDDAGKSDLAKSLEGFRAYKAKIDLLKSEKAIKSIGKSMRDFKLKLGKSAAVNMNDTAKKALTLQEKIVTDVMKSWEKEEARMAKDVSTVLQVEGLTKKE